MKDLTPAFWILLASPVLLAGCVDPANTDFMRCEFESSILSFSSSTPLGEKYPPRSIDAITFKRDGRNLYFDYEDETIEWKKMFLVAENFSYQEDDGSYIALIDRGIFAEANLVAISFKRREAAVAVAFSAHYTEASAQWLTCK